jgi:hypothetical protein
MKKIEFQGKALSKVEQQKLKGGITDATRSIWSCATNLYECYFTRGECFAYCPRPNIGCRLYIDCP